MRSFGRPEPIAAVNPESRRRCVIIERCLRRAETATLAPRPPRDLSAPGTASRTPRRASGTGHSGSTHPLPPPRLPLIGARRRCFGHRDAVPPCSACDAHRTGGSGRAPRPEVRARCSPIPPGCRTSVPAPLSDPYCSRWRRPASPPRRGPIRLATRAAVHKPAVADAPAVDNFEHLIPAAGIVSELLAAGPALKVLVTSRAALHVYGEHELPVAPLGLPTSGVSSLKDLAASPAVSLFVQRALAVKPDFELTRENAPPSRHLQPADVLRLSISADAPHQAALAAACGGLESGLQLLTGGARTPRAAAALRAAMAGSTGSELGGQRLPSALRLRRGCTLEGGGACARRCRIWSYVFAASPSIVQSLLQQVRGGETRFVMLGTIREYGQERLAASGEERATRRAHAAYALVLAEEGTSQSPEKELQWLDRLEVEHENLRAALDWLIRENEGDWAVRMGGALFRFGRPASTSRRDATISARSSRYPPPRADETAAAGALRAGVLRGRRGIKPSRCLSMRRAGDRPGARRPVGRGRRPQCPRRARPGRRAARRRAGLHRGGHRPLEGARRPAALARALSNVANIARARRLRAGASALRGVPVHLCRARRPQRDAWSLNHLGDVARALGDAERARRFYDEGLEAFRRISDRWGTATCLADLGNCARTKALRRRSRPL